MSKTTVETSTNETENKLWGGRFSESTDAFVQAFTASITFDKRLANQDIQGSEAHAAMLHKVGLLTAEELAAINDGLAARIAENALISCHSVQQHLQVPVIR